MSVAAIALVKNEADVIERTVRAMIDEVDFVIVADNGSTDGTREILKALDVELLDDVNPAHEHGAKMTKLARYAGVEGADWVVPFDGDELWLARGGGPRLADVIEAAAGDGAWILTARILQHVATGDDFSGDPLERMAWREPDPLPLLKIAARVDPALVICEGNHSCHYAGEYPMTIDGLLEVHHFPYRSPDQFVEKVRKSYAGRQLTDWPEDQSQHVREFGAILDEGGADALRAYFREHLTPDPSTLVLDPCPPAS